MVGNNVNLLTVIYFLNFNYSYILPSSPSHLLKQYHFAYAALQHIAKSFFNSSPTYEILRTMPPSTCWATPLIPLAKGLQRKTVA